MTEFIHTIEDEEEGKIVSGASSRRAAKWFNYGIYDLYKINHDTWVDCVIEPHRPFEDDQ
ncbi:MAG: hypothetical protein IE913_09775 [Halothiobacillus sp.]|nr:hypothetical protein [Halothiobacillus sp.]